MKRIYIVRHGETIWNTEGRTQGIQDSELTERGILQAQRLGYRLKSENIKCIYSSPLKRAQATAEHIRQIVDVDIKYEDGLKEINFGFWEGLTNEEIRQKYPLEMDIWRNSPHEANIPNGEKLLLAQERIVHSINQILQDEQHNNILIISHSTTIKLWLLNILNMDLSNYYRLKQDQCALNIIEYPSYGPVLLKYNDTCYMDIMSNEGETNE